ncbi:hypothetical protein ACSCB1_13680 [Streptomyces europaeiscabiei]|uniref:hypothetical protein n=1 Tax=Streptomyces europaeiscabiei TaxID=146819 RepID=UPI000AFE6FE7|nr:hypothetical protein [Streptomyces europaeiscabiei]
MPAAASTRVNPSVLDLLDFLGRPAACPGCGVHAPAWTRVVVDGLSVLTHDGDVICPKDRHFGAMVQPALGASPVPVLEVAA